jgi:hypothetical protein
MPNIYIWTRQPTSESDDQVGNHIMSTDTDGPMNVSLKNILSYILFEKSGMTESQFENAFSDRDIARSLLQKVLSEKGAILNAEQQECANLPKRTLPLADALKLTSGVRQPLGNMLVKSRVITREQLDQALNVQQQTGEKIGEICARLGMLDASALDAFLKSQQESQQTLPVQAAFKIGDILVASGHITKEQLNESLEQQKHSHKKLGEILVEKGYVEQQHVEHGIRLQQMLVTAALGTVMSLSSVGSAEAGHSSSVATASVQVSVVIKPVARVKVLHQEPRIEITRQQIAQGYIDVALASSIEVRTNVPTGCLLTIENHGGPFREVYVNGLGNEIQLQAGNGWVIMPYTPVPKTLELSYRFMLAADARPGSYPWPMQITATLM